MVTKRARLWLRRGATVTITLLVIAVGGSTWLYSSAIDETLRQVPESGPSYDLVLESATPVTVRLPVTSETLRPGVWGLDFQGGFAEVGEVLDRTEDSVLRTLIGVRGLLRGSAVVDFSPQIGRDPLDRGVRFTEVLIQGPLGDYPAWEIGGQDDTWVIVVHSNGAGRRQALAVVPSIVSSGYPVLVPTYRNHEDAPESEDRRFSLGEDERRDLEAAVEHAFRGGARDIVLLGLGSGSAVVGEFMRVSPWAEYVVGVALDSPLLDPGAAVDATAKERNVPGFVVGWAKALAALRFGIDWNAADQVKRAEEWETPLLLLHGDGDEVAPIASSEALADLRPEMVTLVRFPEAVHVGVWNSNPARYEDVLSVFLDEHARGASAFEPVDPDEVARRARRS